MKYLYEKNNIIYAKCNNCDRVLKFKKYEIDEVSTGVECFCGECSYSIEGLPQKAQTNAGDIVLQKSNTQPERKRPEPVRIRNVPTCPTCGSQRVEKISLTSKAIGGAMWGLFSSNIRNTFKCRSCGYKW